jgi:hypothetical protein
LHRFFGATILQMMLGLVIAVCDDQSDDDVAGRYVTLSVGDRRYVIREELREVDALIAMQLIVLCRGE